MENVPHTVFEIDRLTPQKDPRLHDRRSVCLRVAVADKSGHGSRAKSLTCPLVDAGYA